MHIVFCDLYSHSSRFTLYGIYNGRKRRDDSTNAMNAKTLHALWHFK